MLTMFEHETHDRKEGWVHRDRLGRPLRSLRLSVTDRCNLRCQYCMPENEYSWLDRKNILHFEEIIDLIDIFIDLGVRRLRLTGGEPLMRRELHTLVQYLAKRPKIRDLAMTTNGILLADHALLLRKAGLHRITISLDTLSPGRFRRLTGQDHHQQVLEGIETATQAGFSEIKINTLVLRGVNDDELPDIIQYGNRIGAQVRFIEYMDVGGATRWSYDQVFSYTEILKRLAKRFGPIIQEEKGDGSPAKRFRLPDGTEFGIITTVNAPFCDTCDRSRLTADGFWYRCLYAKNGTDLGGLLRSGVPKREIKTRIIRDWEERMDRGAMERSRLKHRGPLFQINDLRNDPHLEMHTRGG